MIAEVISLSMAAFAGDWRGDAQLPKLTNRRKYLPMRRLIPKIIAVGLLWAGSARAGDQTFTFDTNPTNDPSFIIYGQHLAGCWHETNGDPGGYIAITDSISDPETGTQ